MIRTRGRDTIRVTEVKGHAENVDVQHGLVRLEDHVGNAQADTAADLGCRHQSEVLVDVLVVIGTLFCLTCIVYDCC